MIVASAILATGVLAASHLLLLAAASNVTAMHATRSALIATQKLEELRACCPGDHSALATSPPAALWLDTAGAVDYLDAYGRPLAGGPPLPAGTVYTRRWSVAPLPHDPDGTLVLQVVVTPWRTATGRRPGDAWLVTLRTREAP